MRVDNEREQEWQETREVREKWQSLPSKEESKDNTKRDQDEERMKKDSVKRNTYVVKKRKRKERSNENKKTTWRDTKYREWDTEVRGKKSRDIALKSPQENG